MTFRAMSVNNVVLKSQGVREIENGSKEINDEIHLPIHSADIKCKTLSIILLDEGYSHVVLRDRCWSCQRCSCIQEKVPAWFELVFVT